MDNIVFPVPSFNVQRRLGTYLDGLPLTGDLRSEPVKELPVPTAPTFFVGGTFGTVAKRDL
jgi:hypothetical protein